MSEQGDLFADGWALARVGISQAEDNADSEWLTAARRTVRDLAVGMEPWTTDIVWSRLEVLGVATHEPRALGALIRQAAKAGLIRQQGYTPTKRPEAHARPIPVWVGTGKRAA